MYIRVSIHMRVCGSFGFGAQKVCQCVRMHFIMLFTISAVTLFYRYIHLLFSLDILLRAYMCICLVCILLQFVKLKIAFANPLCFPLNFQRNNWASLMTIALICLEGFTVCFPLQSCQFAAHNLMNCMHFYTLNRNATFMISYLERYSSDYHAKKIVIFYPPYCTGE